MASLNPEELEKIAEKINKGMESFYKQLDVYTKCYTIKILLVVVGGYSNEEADKKLQEMIENGENSQH